MSKYSIAYCKKVAESKGGNCLSKKYIGINDKNMKWKCKRGHIFTTSLNSVKHSKNLCRICAGFSKITLQQCQEYAISKEGECLSKSYKNMSYSMKWKCKRGHIWIAVFSAMKYRGTWCKKCSFLDKKKKIKKPCIHCKKIYESWNIGNSIYCSDNCGRKFRKKHGNSIRLKQIKKNCLICEKKFFAPPTSSSIFCSRTCSNTHSSIRTRKTYVVRETFTCKKCNKKFIDLWYKFRKYCSKECFHNRKVRGGLNDNDD